MSEYPVVEYVRANFPLKHDAEAGMVFSALRKRYPQINETTKAVEFPLEHAVGFSSEMALEIGAQRYPVLSMHLPGLPSEEHERAPIHAAYSPLNDTMYFFPYPVQKDWGSIDAYVRAKRDAEWDAGLHAINNAD